MTIWKRSLAPVLALTLCGCGGGGPKTHPVAGRVEVTGGNPAPLAGSTVEVALDRDPTVRAFGEIQPDGQFELQSLHAGEVRAGIPEGTYAVRIIPNDEDPAARKRATFSIAMSRSDPDLQEKVGTITMP